MVDERYATLVSVWLVIVPMLISIYIASLLIASIFVNSVDEYLFNHLHSEIRSYYIYFSIFIAFMFTSFCISISTFIAIPQYKKLFMVIVFFIPIIWPNLISLFFFGVENSEYTFSGMNIELIVFILGSIIGGFIAYNIAYFNEKNANLKELEPK